MTKEYAVQTVLYSAAVSSTIVQTEHVFQIIQIVITCIAAAVSLAYTLYKWWKKSSQDDKIDIDELKEGIDILDKGAEELTKKLEELKNKTCSDTETKTSETSKNK